jgi:uncharacterized glyoxalase superfamily protein PhnB
MKITPVLIVEEIEQLLPFWVDRIGFAKVAEVPDENRLGFVILIHEGAELMLQTVASVRKDEPKFAPTGPASGTSLFIEVADLDDILSRLEGFPLEMPERRTFYGMREIGVRLPDGHVVVFAQKI